jgi:hypothetical protein
VAVVAMWPPSGVVGDSATGFELPAASLVAGLVDGNL